MDSIDCAVIGSGPAGMIASLYLLRFLRSVLVFDHGKSRARWIPKTHNCPGFAEGIAGTEYLKLLRAQIDVLGATVIGAEVSKITAEGAGFRIETDQGRYLVKTVLLATGVSDVVPPIDGLAQLREEGALRQCPICDGYEYRGRRIGVLGVGAHGVREAEFIQTYSRDLFLACHEPLEASFAVRLASDGIDRLDGPITGTRRDGDEIVVVTAAGERRCDVLYAAFGTAPHATLGTALGAKVDEMGHLLVSRRGETTVQNLFAAGDVIQGLDQISVAAGSAAIAATGIHNRLAGRV